MNFKYFPVTFTSDGRKLPLIKGWQTEATTNPDKLRMWQEQFRDRLHYWGIPTGSDAGILVLDIDTKNNGFESIQHHNLQVPLTMSQRTKSGGAHYLFNYPQDGKRYGNRANIYPGVDVRGEGGFIVCYGLDATHICNAPTWLLEETVKPPPMPQGEPVTISAPIAESILNNALEAIREAPEGERNNTLNTQGFRVNQLVASGAITQEYASQVLSQAASDIGLGTNETKKTIQSTVEGAFNKPLSSPFGPPSTDLVIPPVPQEERWTPNYFSLNDLLNTSHLRKPQLFKDWSTEDIHITTADGGTGKTTLKLFEAICLALGESFLGFQCITPGKTLFITGEDTANKLGAMLGVILKQMGVLEDQGKLNKILDSIVVKKDADLCIISKDKQGFLQPSTASVEKLKQAIDDIKPKLIVFDPISSFWGSEAALNDMAKAVIRFMGHVQEYSGACVEMINHMGKQSSTNKDMSQFAGRGGTGLPSHSRVSRVLRTVQDDEYMELTGTTLDEGQSAILCNVNKFTDGSHLFNKPFLIIRQGYLFSRVSLDSVKQREETKQMSDIERVFNFIRECRTARKFPTKSVIIGHFATSNDKLSADRTKRAIDMLMFNGFQGILVKSTQGPDALSSEKVFILTDADGREV